MYEHGPIITYPARAGHGISQLQTECVLSQTLQLSGHSLDTGFAQSVIAILQNCVLDDV